jgi:hypothetical protein
MTKLATATVMVMNMDLLLDEKHRILLMACEVVDREGGKWLKCVKNDNCDKYHYYCISNPDHPDWSIKQLRVVGEPLFDENTGELHHIVESLMP